MRNFYEMAVKDKLLKYTYAKEFLARIDNDIMCLKNKEKNKNMIGKYGISSGAGGSLSQEEIILNINAEIDLLEKNRQTNIDLIERMDKAMEGMSELERDITLEIYGKNKRDGRIETLKSKYHYSQSQIYRIANDGVRHISLMLYGNC